MARFTFPDSFDKVPHHCFDGGFHWTLDVGGHVVSVVSGEGAHGDGVNDFEAWFPQDAEPEGYVTAEWINGRLATMCG